MICMGTGSSRRQGQGEYSQTLAGKVTQRQGEAVFIDISRGIVLDRGRE